MSRMSALAPLLCAGLSLFGGDEWPSFRGDPALNGVAESTLPAQPVLRWSFQAGKAIVSSPVVAAERLVIGCDDGNVYCLDARTGEKRWTHATGDVIEAPPLIHAGTVYVGSSNGLFFALDPRGRYPALASADRRQDSWAARTTWRPAARRA